MLFSEEIRAAISEFHLLSHPFYQAWTKGTLTQDELRHYAVQYVPFIDAFPRFVSALHSHCEDEAARKEILENLMDEEGRTGRSAPHPELWRHFIEGLGAADDGTGYSKVSAKLKSDFFGFCRASYAEGLCALYAYEYQSSDISKTKIDGLKTFYGVTDDRSVEFFRVHETADMYHSDTCAKMIDAIPAEDQARSLAAARNAAQSLWDFLSSVQSADPHNALEGSPTLVHAH